MNDLELAEYLGIARTKGWENVLASLSAASRAGFEAMHAKEQEIKAYMAGTGPRPSGVILCGRNRV